MKREVKAPRLRPRLDLWPQQGLHAAWIGHSTVVLSIDGFIVLTDPVFSNRIGIGLGPVTLGLKRLVAPPLTLAQIPRPDLIFLSHAHMDHFDLPSLRKLEGRGTTVITAVNTSDLLRVKRYGKVHELGWGQSLRVGPATVRAFEVKHWGARMRNDTQRSYNGYVIEAGRYRVVFGGDTAYTDLFKKVRTAKAVDLAIMPIGAYNPWIRAHCTPEQALRMADDVGADFILPVHHGTFVLSSEPIAEPMERLLAAAGEERIGLREIGGEFHWAPNFSLAGTQIR
ncbi:MAG: MBL fold metallo-hydrolase [Acidobacteriota bacterium]|nr:MBL fold metallo-hydrolase [Acidobacteriota bacterium]